MNNMFLSNARDNYTTALSNLSEKEHILELKQFLVDMLDWTQQTEINEIYIKLEKYLSNIENGE